MIQITQEMHEMAFDVAYWEYLTDEDPLPLIAAACRAYLNALQPEIERRALSKALGDAADICENEYQSARSIVSSCNLHETARIKVDTWGNTARSIQRRILALRDKVPTA